MLQNYRYFLALAEELNISRAAARLFISHQCLSKYLKDLEAQYGVALMNRKPRLSLTPAGEMLRDSLRQIELIEGNLESRLADCQDSDSGQIRLGITEGRIRILLPQILTRFREICPRAELATECANSNELQEMVLNNRLDMMLTAQPAHKSSRLSSTLLVNEKLYLIISDNMLREFFPDEFPECRERFLKGADLSEFQHIPFVLNEKGFSSRDMVEQYAMKNDFHIDCVREIVQADLHCLLSARDYAASVCFSMFLPGVSDLNRLNAGPSPLNAFPVKGFDTSNPVRLLWLKNRIFPSCGLKLISLIKEICAPYETTEI